MENEVVESGVLDILLSVDLISALIGASALVVALLIKKLVPADKIPLVKKFLKETDEELKDGE